MMGESSLDELKSKRMWTGVAAEFLGTAMLVLVGVGSANGDSNVQGDVVQIALGVGLSVATIVWAIAHVSGGHINPAVTAAFMVTRRMSLARGFLYMIAQTVGAIVGAALLKGMSSPNAALGAVGLNQDLNSGQGFGVEFFLVFIFLFVIFSSVDEQRSDLGGSVPLTVGLTICIGHLWAVRLTGAGMNPARSLGPAVVLGGDKWNNHWIYWVGPLLGGMTAGLLYEFIFAVNANPCKFLAFFTKNYDNDYFDSKGRKAVKSPSAQNTQLQQTCSSIQELNSQNSEINENLYPDIQH